MKNLTIIIGSTFLILNAIFYAVLTDYCISGFVATESGLLITTILLTVVAVLKIDDAFKIFLVLLLVVLAIVKFYLAFDFHLPIKDNAGFLWFAVITALELLIVISLKIISKFA